MSVLFWIVSGYFFVISQILVYHGVPDPKNAYKAAAVSALFAIAGGVA